MTHPIEYCTDTLNFLTGCLRNCSFCYARRAARVRAGNTRTVYHRVAVQHARVTGLHGNPFHPAVHLDVLDRADEWLTRARKQRRVFMSMSDPFGPWEWYSFPLPDRTVHATETRYRVRSRVIEFAARHPRHVFLVLTKYAEELHGYLCPSNLHLGVSVTRTDDARRRVPFLFDCQAGLRWVSVEPLLDLDFNPRTLKGVDWVVIGAETGPGATKPQLYTERAWAIVLWCKDNEIPVFVKRNMREAYPGLPWPMEIPG